MNRHGSDFLHMVPLSAFPSNGGHDSSLGAQNYLEEVTIQKTTHKEDQVLVGSVQNEKTTHGDVTLPVSLMKHLSVLGT